ncbi:MAG: TetR/AcrR family transcriptional regulator [Cyanobacteria bacterium J06642_2]
MVAKKISGRGRPRKFDLDRAVATAKELFHQRGYDSVGVAELSQVMGITAPSLYAAFGSKSQLFERVLQDYVRTDGGWLPAAIAQAETVEGSISCLFECAAEAYSANPLQLGCLVLDGTRNCTDERVCQRSAEFRQATRDLIRERIATEFPEQAEMLANYVFTILMGLSAAARDRRPKAELLSTARIAAAGFSAHIQDGHPQSVNRT